MFLTLKPGQFVAVQNIAPFGQQESADWWMGQVIFCEGGARDPKVNSLFQIADVDGSEIRWVGQRRSGESRVVRSHKKATPLQLGWLTARHVSKLKLL